YALAEAMGWKSGLERKPIKAQGFYGVIAVSLLAGLVIQYSPISPMKALFWSAVINGVVAVPLMVVIVLLASSKSVMGAFNSSRPIVILGWIGAAVMGLAAVLMFMRGEPARLKKVDPPGGTTGRVGCDTGWMRRPCRTRDPQQKRFRAVKTRQ